MLAFAVSIAVGFVVGILSGMLGIGGGMIMVPAFRLGYAMTALQATATSLFAVIPTSLAGCVGHVRNGTCLPSIGIAAGVVGAFMSPLGVYLASKSPSSMIMVAAAVVIAYSSFTMFHKARLMFVGTANKKKAAFVSPSNNVDSHHSPPVSFRNVRIACLAGAIAGLASGYIGVGGGFIMIPLFVSFLGIEMKKASGTSLIAVSILAIPGAVSQLLLGNVVIGAGLAMAMGSIPGAMVGASLVKWVPERQLRIIFGGLLLVAAVLLVAKELRF